MEAALGLRAYVSIRQHTSAGDSIRQHTSAYVSIRTIVEAALGLRAYTHARVTWIVQQEGQYACWHSIRQHTSAYVSIRQHTSAYVSIRQHTSAYVSIRACDLDFFLMGYTIVYRAFRRKILLSWPYVSKKNQKNEMPPWATIAMVLSGLFHAHCNARYARCAQSQEFSRASASVLNVRPHT